MVTYRTPQIECENWILTRVLPYLNGPVGTAGDEYFGMEMIPPDSIDGHVVGIERAQVLARIGLGAFVDFPLLCTNEKQIVDGAVEVDRCPTTETAQLRCHCGFLKR